VPAIVRTTAATVVQVSAQDLPHPAPVQQHLTVRPVQPVLLEATRRLAGVFRRRPAALPTEWYPERSPGEQAKS